MPEPEQEDLLQKASRLYLQGGGAVDPNTRYSPEEARQKFPFSSSLIDQGLTVKPDIERGESVNSNSYIARLFDDVSAPERDKEMVAFALDRSIARDAYMSMVTESVGEPVRSKGIFSRAMSSTIDIAGKPPARCTSTRTSGARTPTRARLCTIARPTAADSVARRLREVGQFGQALFQRVARRVRGGDGGVNGHNGVRMAGAVHRCYGRLRYGRRRRWRLRGYRGSL